jgi:hypothetical protein
LFRELGRVVVFDHEHAVGIGQDVAQSVGAAGRNRRTRGVLRAAGHHDRGDADRDRPSQTVHCRPFVVDRHGDRFQAQRGDEVDQVGPAGVLDTDPVAGAQVAAEQPLQRIQGAGGHGDGGIGHRYSVGGESFPRHLQ